MSVVTYLSTGDRWIPASIVGFFIGLTGLLSWFVWIAVSTHPGLVTENPYERGREIALALQPQWDVGVAYNGSAGEAHPLQIKLANEDGEPLSNAQMFVMAERPTRHPVVVPIQVAYAGSGVYAADVTLPIGGDWTFRVTSIHGGKKHQAVSQIHVPGSRVK